MGENEVDETWIEVQWMLSLYKSDENKKNDLMKSLTFGSPDSPSKTARSRSKMVEGRRYVKVEPIVLCFERADMTSPEGSTAMVGASWPTHKTRITYSCICTANAAYDACWYPR